MRVRSHLLGLTLVSLAASGACNEHVFRQVELECDRTLETDVAVNVEKAADILIVVDNSGSMCEEQANLAQNFFDANCPLTDRELRERPNEAKEFAKRKGKNCIASFNGMRFVVEELQIEKFAA